jgi:hypothetical protein
MKTKNTGVGNTYRISIKESLTPETIAWFGDLTVTSLEGSGTLLTGAFPDQPALRGFLTQLWNLNFTVESVEKIGNGFHQEPDIE